MPSELKLAGEANANDVSADIKSENLYLKMELCKANIWGNQLLLEKLEREMKERESGPNHR